MKVPCFRIFNSPFYFIDGGDDFVHASKINTAFGFIETLLEKPIAPKETIRGWIYFDPPKGEHFTNWRFRTKDVAGIESLQPFTFKSSFTNMDIDLEHTVGETRTLYSEDISMFPKYF